jgi:cytochrome c oxidase cbb3-type subunit 4
MLKFIKGHAESIVGIEVFPIIAFFIFFLFFLGLMFYVAKYTKEEVEELSNLPLENDSTQS